jgi:hypothetical protein
MEEAILERTISGYEVRTATWGGAGYSNAK